MSAVEDFCGARPYVSDIHQFHKETVLSLALLVPLIFTPAYFGYSGKGRLLLILFSEAARRC